MLLGTALVFPATADAVPTHPAPATGLLWFDSDLSGDNSGQLSQWTLDGTGAVYGPDPWALDCINGTQACDGYRPGPPGSRPAVRLPSRSRHLSGWPVRSIVIANATARWVIGAPASSASGMSCSTAPIRRSSLMLVSISARRRSAAGPCGRAR